MSREKIAKAINDNFGYKMSQRVDGREPIDIVMAIVEKMNKEAFLQGINIQEKRAVLHMGGIAVPTKEFFWNESKAKKACK